MQTNENHTMAVDEEGCLFVNMVSLLNAMIENVNLIDESDLAHCSDIERAWLAGYAQCVQNVRQFYEILYLESKVEIGLPPSNMVD